MPIYYEWTSKRGGKDLVTKCPSFQVTSHPLKTNSFVIQSTSETFIENVNKWVSTFEEEDPLLKFEELNLDESTNPCEVLEIKNHTKQWSTRRALILNKYTTGEKLSIISSFLAEGEKGISRQVSNLNEKVKHRLEQLDDFDESSVKKTMGLSQQEFTVKINMLTDEIKKAWSTEQRVKAFKIAIQCSKLLSDISVMQFYPSKFVLITDTLDTFGKLVFDRLKEKSFGKNGPKSFHEIDPDTVPDTAKETCHNWIFKMASIRELLPRLYMEITLLKCYAFISKDDIKSALQRLTTMIRGISNSLVSIYLRCYLCRVAADLVDINLDDTFYNNLKEFIEEYEQIFHPVMIRNYEMQMLTLDKYYSLYTPAVDWILYGILNSNRHKDTLLEELLEKCKNLKKNDILLCCLVSSFDSSSVIHHASCILNIINTSVQNIVVLNEIMTSLGEHLCASDNQTEAENIIQTWLNVTSFITSTNDFLQVLEPWIQYACTHLSSQRVNVILRGTIRFMVTHGQPADECSGRLHMVIKRMMKSVPEVEEVFLMDAFMPLLDLVQTSNARTVLAKTLLSTFFSRHSTTHIEDPIIISSLMRLCCQLHDSINAVTVEDESKVTAELINKYIRAVSYNEDLEQQLNFYVECRSAFIKLDSVLVQLVHAVNKLAVRADPVRGKWLQRACAAYCFITVPSLRCTLTKTQLYLLSGQVALLNNCIGQAEANFKALIKLIPDIPEFILEDSQKKPTHIQVSSLLSDLLSTLLILPDNMNSNCKAYVLSGFIKTMERIHWSKTDPLYYNTLLRLLDLLCEMTRDTYAYHVESVISNDKLYGSDDEFIGVIEKFSTNICQELLTVLKALGDAKEVKKQYKLALDLFWCVTRRGDLSEESMISLATNLWKLSQKLQTSDSKLANSMLSALSKNHNKNSSLLDKLINN